MAYMMLETSIRTHRKFLAAGCEASWLWVCGLGYCQDGLTNGFIPDAALEFLGVPNPKRLAKTLLAVKLWDRVKGGYRMHDYLDHNKPAEVVREIMRLRREGGKLGGRPRKNLGGSQNNNLQGFDTTKPPAKPPVSSRRNLPENPVLPVLPVRPELPVRAVLAKAEKAAAPPRRQSATTHESADPERNYHVIERLVHDVMDLTGEVDASTLVESVKSRCAQLHIAYSPGNVVHRAVDSALVQRRRKAASA